MTYSTPITMSRAFSGTPSQERNPSSWTMSRTPRPPPTPTPLATSTIDPTLAAQFAIQPTQTRMPTFTPPPPLEVPEFSDNSRSSVGATGIFILLLGLLGGAGLLASFLMRK